MKIKFVNLEEFRLLAKTDEAQDVAVRSDSVDDVEAKADAAKTRRLSFSISSGTEDRQQDVVNVDGWDLANFQKNPVVLWAHNYRQIPVGRSVKLWKHAGKLKSETEFTPVGMDAFNDTVFSLYHQGFLKATSVGFRPLKWDFSKDEKRPYGVDFKEQELLEYSMVPVPAHPDALIEARSAGIELEPLKRWAEDVLLSTKGIEAAPHVDILAGIDPKSLAADVATEIHKLLHPTTPAAAAESAIPVGKLIEVVRRQVQIARFRL